MKAGRLDFNRWSELDAKHAFTWGIILVRLRDDLLAAIRTGTFRHALHVAVVTLAQLGGHF